MRKVRLRGDLTSSGYLPFMDEEQLSLGIPDLAPEGTTPLRLALELYVRDGGPFLDFNTAVDAVEAPEDEDSICSDGEYDTDGEYVYYTGDDLDQRM